MSLEEKNDIKELLELIAGLKAVGVAGAEVASDGKLDLSDIVALKKLAEQHEILIAAIKGLGDAIPEAKDIDLAESGILIAQLVDLAKAVKAASKVVA